MQLRTAGLDADQAFHLGPARQAGHGGQGRAQVGLAGLEQVGHAGLGADDLGQGRLDGGQGGGPGLGVGGRGVGQVQQAGQLLGPVLAGRDRGGDAGPQQEGAVGIGGQPLGGAGEAFLVQVGQVALLERLHQVGDGALDQALEGADQFVDRHAPGLGLGDGDLLQGVLQVGAGGFQLLDQVGTVQQLERRGVVAVQEAFQQPADAVARVGGVEVGRLDAEGIKVLLHLLGLAAVDLTLGEDRDRLVFAGLGVEGFLADAGTAMARPAPAPPRRSAGRGCGSRVAMSSVHCAPSLRRTNSS